MQEKVTRNCIILCQNEVLKLIGISYAINSCQQGNNPEKLGFEPMSPHSLKQFSLLAKGTRSILFFAIRQNIQEPLVMLVYISLQNLILFPAEENFCVFCFFLFFVAKTKKLQHKKEPEESSFVGSVAPENKTNLD